MPRPKRQSDEIVLDTALQVILDKGPASFTLTDVAVAVGLSRAALIQRFTDKATLHRKVMERMTQAVRNYFAELSPEPGLDPLWSMLKDLIAGMAASEHDTDTRNAFARKVTARLVGVDDAVSRRQLLGRKVVIVDRRPAVQIGARKPEIGLDQAVNPVIGSGVQPLANIIGPKLKRPRVDRDQQQVQRAEDVVERSDRIADPLGHLPRGKARETDLGHVLVALDHKQVLQLLPRMIRTSAHRPCIAESRFGKAEETSVFIFY